MAEPSIVIRENGPYLVRGVGSLTDHDGTEMDAGDVMALCRCGNSQSKPFCDGTHSVVDFDGTCAKVGGDDKE